ncbi:MAG: tyrosine-type recombinase/integrase, partial [Xanthobacteraceae bacterium]
SRAAMPKLTKRFVESVKPIAEDQVIFDDAIPGFGLRVLPTGVRSYLVQYRNRQGRSRRLTLGKHGKMTADAARKSALRIFAAVRDGKDPVAERRAYIDAPIVNDLLDRYIAEHVEKRNRPRTREEIKRLIERHIRPALGRHKVAAVTRQDVAKLHRDLADTPRQGNFVVAVASKAFSLAEAWSMRPEGSNPCSKIERYPENARERFLSVDELARLGATLRQAETAGLPWNVNTDKATAKHLPKPENRRTLYSRVTTAAVELLLFTGCRLSEVLNLRWDQVDFKGGIMTLRETKAGRPQVVVMNAPARQVLKQLNEAESSEWVLPSIADRSRPLSKTAIENAWQRIRSAAELADVRLHDLRHTVGSHAGQSGANAFLVRDLLRHKNLSMTSRYVNRADDPVRTLSEMVGEKIAAGLAGRKSGEVVEFKRGAV